MVATIERKIYQIPIPDKVPVTDTGMQCEQIRKIPVIHTESKIGPDTFQYLRFSIIPGEYSPLDILAGSGNPEIAGARIRAQMIHCLRINLAALQQPDHSPNAPLVVKQIQPYFRLQT